MDISCVVLAGGKGLRLGQDKALETIGNKSLLHWVVSYLSLFKSNIIIVTAEKQSLSQLTDYPELRIVTDAYPDKGPLAGIYTGLAASDSFYNLVVACDMPFLNYALLNYMLQISADFDLVIPRLGDMVEPLHAVYSKTCLPPIQSLLEQGNLSVRGLFSLVRVRYVEATEINRFDPEHLSFFNINTEADLDKARQMIKRCLSISPPGEI
ncbi:putative molybdenum cofactor guanylyltransferase [subsurface metagenome]